MKKWKHSSKVGSLENKQLRTVIGVVTPIGWDKNGQAIRFSIFTHDEEDLIIETSKLNKKLSLLLNQTIEAVGTIYINKNREKCIRVQKIKGIRGPSSPVPLTNRVHSNSSWLEEYSLNIPKELALLKVNNINEYFPEAC